MFQTFSFPNKLKVIQVFKELGEKKEKKKKSISREVKFKILR